LKVAFHKKHNEMLEGGAEMQKARESGGGVDGICSKMVARGIKQGGRRSKQIKQGERQKGSKRQQKEGGERLREQD
jgi:hypothetical protein